LGVTELDKLCCVQNTAPFISAVTVLVMCPFCKGSSKFDKWSLW